MVCGYSLISLWIPLRTWTSTSHFMDVECVTEEVLSWWSGDMSVGSLFHYLVNVWLWKCQNFRRCTIVENNFFIGLRLYNFYWNSLCIILFDIYGLQKRNFQEEVICLVSWDSSMNELGLGSWFSSSRISLNSTMQYSIPQKTLTCWSYAFYSSLF